MSCVICGPDFYGATYEKMGELGFIQWPCRDTSDADQGTSYLFKESLIPRTVWRSSSPATG
ncbi:formate dehydrogenase-H subunit alpha [Escherichia coli]|uniref:Formate dehydrogenase-H subunit alpha n=1 Tax=Escherichia coli TaxID=562 RepID=A0A2X1N575_ECOLX|nr:formate dehydrogenase-H subunit alpha [Escherichia coli]